MTDLLFVETDERALHGEIEEILAVDRGELLGSELGRHVLDGIRCRRSRVAPARKRDEQRRLPELRPRLDRKGVHNVRIGDADANVNARGGPAANETSSRPTSCFRAPELRSYEAEALVPGGMGLDVLDFDGADPVPLKRGGDLLLGPVTSSRGFAQRPLKDRPVKQQAIPRAFHRFPGATSEPQPKHDRPSGALDLIPSLAPRNRPPNRSVEPRDRNRDTRGTPHFIASSETVTSSLQRAAVARHTTLSSRTTFSVRPSSRMCSRCARVSKVAGNCCWNGLCAVRSKASSATSYAVRGRP